MVGVLQCWPATAPSRIGVSSLSHQWPIASETAAGTTETRMPATGRINPYSRTSLTASGPADSPTAAMNVASPKSLRISAAGDGSEPSTGARARSQPKISPDTRQPPPVPRVRSAWPAFTLSAPSSMPSSTPTPRNTKSVLTVGVTR
ncbi:hypothetical protein D9M72_587890 [compost metagenome]